MCGDILNVTSGEWEKVHTGCRKLLKYVDEPVCCKCGKHLEGLEEYCKDCKNTHHFFDRALPVFEYNDEIKSGIYDFKYNNKRIYADFFAEEMYLRYKRVMEVWDINLIIPVPMFKKKERERGYNQANLLAQKLSVVSGLVCRDDILIRKRKTEPMKELGRTQRLSNLKGAFEVSKNLSTIYNSRIILIDDIYTTGTTLDECSLVLKKAGACRVYGITLCIGEGF